jgi:hypothetical protein
MQAAAEEVADGGERIRSSGAARAAGKLSQGISGVSDLLVQCGGAELRAHIQTGPV